MDYEEIYKKALERARYHYEVVDETDKKALAEIFPELAESEDERIRKALIRYVKVYGDGGDFTKEEYIAWLEKHTEQKPRDPVDTADASWDAYYQRGLNKGYELGLEAGRKEQKPAEWSEEDELKLRLCVESLSVPQTKRHIYEYGVTPDELCIWLKSLRPQPKWKPTEEQMINLRCAISGCSYDIEPLVELEEKLKKL